MSNLQYQRISLEAGAPQLRDCGMPVEAVIDMLAQGLTFDEILDACKTLEREDIEACLEFAYAK